jgi:hypothetical protein
MLQQQNSGTTSLAGASAGDTDPLQHQQQLHQPSDEGIDLVEEMTFTIDDSNPAAATAGAASSLMSHQFPASGATGTSGVIMVRKKKKTIFQCTWPGCDARYRQNTAIDRHVRSAHSVDAGEEEFYYTEIEHEVRIKNMSIMGHQQNPAASAADAASLGSPASLLSSSPSVSFVFDAASGNMSGSSCDSSNSSSSQSPISSPAPHQAAVHYAPRVTTGTSPGACFTFHGSGTTALPTWSHMDMARPAHEDPEYQRQLLHKQHSVPIAIPGLSFTHDAAFLPTPKAQQIINQNKFMRITSESATTQRFSPGSSLLQAAVSPKSRVGRTRGEARKCRKVYGMESRELWCTQCKWKKACTRFHD